MTDLTQYYATAGRIYKFFLANGLTAGQACGILAQASAESSLRPSVIGDHGEAHGLFQLHADRIAAIKAGCGIDIVSASVEDQCKAVLWELKNSEHKAYRALLAAKTAYDSGHDMCRFYERPASTAQYAVRGNAAEKWLVHFIKNPVA